MSSERKFEGVWIPANIWLSKDLTLQEKCFLVEIKSLDNENGCFKSNKGFASHFQLSVSRCSEVINKLKEKGLITIDIALKENSKQVHRRTIRVNYNHEIFKEGIRKLEVPMRESEGGIRDSEEPIRKTRKGVVHISKTDKISTTNNTNNLSSEIYAAVQNNIRFNLSPIEQQTISYWISDYPHELILEAVKRAVLSNKNTLAYVERILKSWQRKRVTTLQEVQRDDEEFAHAKNKKQRGANYARNEQIVSSVNGTARDDKWDGLSL